MVIACLLIAGLITIINREEAQELRMISSELQLYSLAWFKITVLLVTV